MTDGLNRRQFLDGAAATTAAAGYAVTCGTALAQESPSDKIVVGVMGLSRGRALATRFSGQSNVDVKYVCDVDSNRAAAAAKQLEEKGHKTRPIGDFRKMLEDSDLDALICAAPNHWHAPATILACSAGRHTYVEKPCSHNPNEGELMVEAARKHGCVVQMGTQRRSSEPIRAAMKFMWDGGIGRVYHSTSWYGNVRGSIRKGKPVPVPAHLDYDMWQGPAPRMPYYDNRIHYNWHWFWHWGNGELGNNGIHALDLCRWGLQVEFPTRVISAGGRYRFDDDQQTPDTHNVAFEFEGGKSVTWDGLSCNRHRNDFVTFYGESGAVVIEGGGNCRVYDEKDKLAREFKGNQGDEEHIANFLSAIRNDDPDSLNQEILSGHKSTLLCHLGNIAQRTGRTLNCSSKDGKILGDEKAMVQWSREYEPGWEPQV